MRKALAGLLFAATITGPTFANTISDADYVINCVSGSNGDVVTLARSGGVDKGFIIAGDIQGEASILSGLDSATFLHIAGGNVITFIVDLTDNTYDMTTKGTQSKSDYGDCSPPDISE